MHKKDFCRGSVIAVVLLGCAILTKAETETVVSDINAKIAQLNFETAGLDDIVRIFGEPAEYVWGGETFRKDNLPMNYIVRYPKGFSIFLRRGRIVELRHEGREGYLFRGKLQIGSSLNEVLYAIGKPSGIIVRGPNGYKDGILYKDIDDIKGRCYYSRKDQGVRFFFDDYKISGLYTTRSDSYVGGDVQPGFAADANAVAQAADQNESAALNINAQMAQLDINTATIDDVIGIFGEPTKYAEFDQTFTKNNLPPDYTAVYPNEFKVVISDGEIEEIRHEGPDGYLFRDKIRIGSSLEDVLKVVGQPKEIITGKQNEAGDGILYKDIAGRKGFCYYGRSDQNVRFFFTDYKVNALYITNPSYGKSKNIGKEEEDLFKTIQPITSVKEFNDVRWKNISELDLPKRRSFIATLTFNQKTIWPVSAGDKPQKVLTEAMNPGLGVRKLHKEGITGKGVNVAIIDQPLYQDHPEFAGKITAYYDTGCESESSMHGPAVASLLVGTNCGTAPDAKVYYAAVPSWKKDSAYYAGALDWIIKQNKTLPAPEKIRVVSVSAAPSGPDSPFTKNQQMWDKACARAEAAGIMVLDCTTHHGFIGACWYDSRQPESVALCTPGYPGMNKGKYPRRILVPASPRTTAEEQDKGDFGYQYNGRGGLSWSIPYCAGVLALGWEVRPELTPQQMHNLLFQSAYATDSGEKIINPRKFINLVKYGR